MHFNLETLKRINDLTGDEENAFFFDGLGEADPEVPRELFVKLSEIFAAELGLRNQSDVDKLAFLFELGFAAGKARVNNKCQK